MGLRTKDQFILLFLFGSNAHCDVKNYDLNLGDFILLNIRLYRSL